jgi:L-asparaginase/Glu-tRNA(Gln) amidotransferase subunit D
MRSPKGVPVVITSRVPNGRVLPNYGWEGGGKTVVDAGAVMGDDLSPQKARILRMLLLRSLIWSSDYSASRNRAALPRRWRRKKSLARRT